MSPFARGDDPLARIIDRPTIPVPRVTIDPSPESWYEDPETTDPGGNLTPQPLHGAWTALTAVFEPSEEVDSGIESGPIPATSTVIMRAPSAHDLEAETEAPTVWVPPPPPAVPPPTTLRFPAIVVPPSAVVTAPPAPPLVVMPVAPAPPGKGREGRALLWLLFGIGLGAVLSRLVAHLPAL